MYFIHDCKYTKKATEPLKGHERTEKYLFQDCDLRLLNCVESREDKELKNT